MKRLINRTLLALALALFSATAWAVGRLCRVK